MKTKLFCFMFDWNNCLIYNNFQGQIKIKYFMNVENHSL